MRSATSASRLTSPASGSTPAASPPTSSRPAPARSCTPSTRWWRGRRSRTGSTSPDPLRDPKNHFQQRDSRHPMDELHTNAYEALQKALDSRDRGGDQAYEATHAEADV